MFSPLSFALSGSPQAPAREASPPPDFARPGPLAPSRSAPLPVSPNLPWRPSPAPHRALSSYPRPPGSHVECSRPPPSPPTGGTLTYTFNTTPTTPSPAASPPVPSLPAPHAPPPAPCKKHPSRHFTYQGVDSGSEIRHQWTGLWAETHTLATLAHSQTLHTLAHTHIHSAPRSHTDVFKGQHNVRDFRLKGGQASATTASSEDPTDII